LLTGVCDGFAVGIGVGIVFVTITPLAGVVVVVVVPLLPTTRERVGIGVGCAVCAEKLIVRNKINAKTEKTFFVIGIVPVRETAIASRKFFIRSTRPRTCDNKDSLKKRMVVKFIRKNLSQRQFLFIDGIMYFGI
jgi:hypothetical protein